MDNYFGVFDCFSPGRGCIRTLVMAGSFTGNDLLKVNVLLKDEGK